MKVSTIILAYFSIVSAVVSPITNFALRDYMGQRLNIAGQQRAIQNGYRRSRRPKINKYRAISIADMLKRVKRAEKMAKIFADMLKITDSYKY